MIKTNLKQSIQMLKQNKFISIITIIGTALAIMMVMVIIVTNEIKTADIAPEINRSNSYYLKFQMTKAKEGGSSRSGCLSYDVYKNYLNNVKSYDMATLFSPVWQDEKYIVRSGESSVRRFESVRICDADYWQVMIFDFLEGRPFSQIEFADGLKTAVISERLATELFGKESAIDKTIYVFKQQYKIVGVVEDVSQAFEFAYSEVWLPYTSVPNYESEAYTAIYVLNNKDKIAPFNEEMKEAERRYAANEDWTLTLMGPYNHRLQMAALFSNVPPKQIVIYLRYALIIAILLVIPALNLSSFSISGIKKRTEEIGIRKAFGAKNRSILTQILNENLLTSLIGGLIGLVLSYFTVIWLKEWLLNVTAGDSIPIAAFVSPMVFVYVVLVCVLLNLISSIVPAYRASKMKIVESLNQNN